MKVNVPVRFKNPWFWVGVVSVAITAIGVDPQTFTNWAAVWVGVKNVLSTAGVGDSERALEYKKPRRRTSK